MACDSLWVTRHFFINLTYEIKNKKLKRNNMHLV